MERILPLGSTVQKFPGEPRKAIQLRKYIDSASRAMITSYFFFVNLILVLP